MPYRITKFRRPSETANALGLTLSPFPSYLSALCPAMFADIGGKPVRNRAWRLFIAGLFAAANGCSESVAPPPKPAPIPATPTAPTGDPTVTHLNAVSGEKIVAAAGSALDAVQLPAVLVTDQYQKPMAGIVVRFRLVGQERGSLTGDSVVTGASGRASPGKWLLSTTTGTNRLLVTASTLQLSFYAEAVAGPTAVIVKAGGDNLSASVGSQVSQAPVVRLEDKYRNPVPNVAVTFAISTGSGTLKNAVVLSNSSGLASVGSWTIGSLGGTKLSARVEGLEPVAFSAYGAPNCSTAATITIGESKTASLNESGCPVGGERVENVYTLSLTHSGLSVFSFQQESGDFQSRFILTTGAGVTIAEAEDSTGTGRATLKALLWAGEYVVHVSSAGTINGGTYRLESKLEGYDVTNCERVFVQSPINLIQSTSSSDCLSTDQRYYDEYVVHFDVGDTIQLAMNYVSGAARMDMFSAAGEYIGGEQTTAYYDESASLVVVPRSGFYTIRAGMYGVRATGQYHMMVQK